MNYDLIILGQGLMGGALACALANSGYKIALIDKNPLIKKTNLIDNKFENRVNAYNRATEKFLKTLGVWNNIPQARIYPFDKVYVGQKTGIGAIEFSAAEDNETHFGSFIENKLVIDALIEKSASFENINLINNTEIENILIENNTVKVKSKNNTIIGKLVIGCDGIFSKVRQNFNLNQTTKDYKQSCIVGTVEFSSSLNKTAWQRFLPTGPIGLLPLQTGFCSLAWSCKQNFAEYLLSLSESKFIQELEKAVSGRLGKIISMPERKAFPLISRHSLKYYKDRAVLIGDAAHTIHPLAGLGANIGMQDVILLSDLLKNIKPEDLDSNYKKILDTYELKRKPHNSLIQSSMTMFDKVFTNSMPGLPKLRDFGLQIANKITPAKKLLIKQAMWL